MRDNRKDAPSFIRKVLKTGGVPVNPKGAQKLLVQLGYWTGVSYALVVCALRGVVHA
jgi:hypothetical protein